MCLSLHLSARSSMQDPRCGHPCSVLAAANVFWTVLKVQYPQQQTTAWPWIGLHALQSQVWVSTLLLTIAWWPRASDFTSLFLFPHLSSGENGSNIDHQDAVRVKRCAACKAISTEKDTWWSGNSTGCSRVMIMIIVVVVLHQGWRLAVLSWRAWVENGARPHL